MKPTNAVADHDDNAIHACVGKSERRVVLTGMGSCRTRQRASPSAATTSTEPTTPTGALRLRIVYSSEQTEFGERRTPSNRGTCEPIDMSGAADTTPDRESIRVTPTHRGAVVESDVPARMTGRPPTQPHASSLRSQPHVFGD